MAGLHGATHAICSGRNQTPDRELQPWIKPVPAIFLVAYSSTTTPGCTGRNSKERHKPDWLNQSPNIIGVGIACYREVSRKRFDSGWGLGFLVLDASSILAL